MDAKQVPTEEPRMETFYANTEDESIDNIHNYDAVLFTVCDLFGRPRGKFEVGKNILRLVRHGIDMPQTTCVQGFRSESSVASQRDAKDVACRMYPDISTLRPLSWLCNGNRKVGHVLCDLYDNAGHYHPSSSRAIALKQLNNLKQLGYAIMSSFEVEYSIYHKGTLNPLGGNNKELNNMVRLDSDLVLLYDHMMCLLASGVPVETQMEESVPGQIEYSMQPQYGIKMADAVHRLRYITKSLCDKQGLEPTFMTRPKHDLYSNGFHFNHSLWTVDKKNAFYDPERDHNCSEVMHHWIAGLIHHGHALTALLNPTVNCYERLHCSLTPGDNVWNYSDRNARLRVKTNEKNIYIEDRMPSSACNPYLCLAGMVAAGADGIARKLQAPPPRDYRSTLDGDERSKAENPLPRSLEEALQALEQDTVLIKAIDEDFVQEYIALCREFQLDKLKHELNKEPAKRFEAERDLYLHSL